MVNMVAFIGFLFSAMVLLFEYVDSTLGMGYGITLP